MGEPLVTVAQGTVRGSIDVDHDGNSYYSFRGIPYAKPPVGELRFKAPVAAEKWDGVFDATKEGDACYARDMFTMEFAGTEDCLILNVFTKSLMSTSNPKPVMVWIHGGGLLYGSSSTTVYSPAFLMIKDVVVVSINYRLGMLGFLSFKDRSTGVPGNAGMKDMVMALRWVQQNIARFGGDPTNVTIFGESAGGASVHLLMLSPMAEGLFHKAIAQSGCGGLNFWATSDGCSVEKLAEAAGRPGSDAKKLLRYLRSLSVEDVLRIQEQLTKKFLPSNTRPFVVVIEDTLNETDQNEPAFLAEQPIDILNQGNYNQVPFMTGFTTGEGMCFEYFSNIYEHLELDFEHVIPHNLGYKMGEVAMKNLVTKVKKYYFGDENPSRQNIDNYFDLLADVTFIYCQAIGIEKLLVKSKRPIYLYRMSVETGLNFLKIVGKLTGKGAAHCDDLGYLFKNFATPDIAPGSPEDVGMRRFVKLWTNFATCGNPTPDDDTDSLLNGVSWKPIGEKNEMHFLEIGMELKSGVNPYRERIEFWREIHANSPSAFKIA